MKPRTCGISRRALRLLHRANSKFLVHLPRIRRTENSPPSTWHSAGEYRFARARPHPIYRVFRERHREIIVHPFALWVKIIATNVKRKIQTMYNGCKVLYASRMCPSCFCDRWILLPMDRHLLWLCIYFVSIFYILYKAWKFYRRTSFVFQVPVWARMTWLSTILHLARMFLSVLYEVEHAR